MLEVLHTFVFQKLGVPSTNFLVWLPASSLEFNAPQDNSDTIMPKLKFGGGAGVNVGVLGDFTLKMRKSVTKEKGFLHMKKLEGDGGDDC